MLLRQKEKRRRKGKKVEKKVTICVTDVSDHLQDIHTSTHHVAYHKYVNFHLSIIFSKAENLQGER